MYDSSKITISENGNSIIVFIYGYSFYITIIPIDELITINEYIKIGFPIYHFLKRNSDYYENSKYFHEVCTLLEKKGWINHGWKSE